tara:strand:- start:938 stop:1099 length:162 start_codon:yes stop_codon:yes gene_type:complete
MENITIQNMGLVDLSLNLNEEALEAIHEKRYDVAIRTLIKSQSFLKVVKIGLL